MAERRFLAHLTDLAFFAAAKVNTPGQSLISRWENRLTNHITTSCCEPVDRNMTMGKGRDAMLNTKG